MLRTLIRLPDGSEIFSGPDEHNTIMSVKFTQSVNSAKELTLGAVCANMLEADIHNPNGGLQIGAGEEITAYKIDEAGNRHLLGLFTLEEPVRPSANTLRITAYDRIAKLDKDLTDWLADLSGWPYSLLTFARMVCQACGLTLLNDTIPNGEYLVQAFTAKGITGRKLMQWVGEAAGRFCRANAEGNLEFGWFTPSGVTLTPDGEHYYYQNSLSYEDYAVMPIEKVQIRQTSDDVGVVWPDEIGEKNTYIISGNYLLTTTATESLLPVAQTLYAHLKDVTYTPCKVKIPAGLDVQAGHMLDVIDKNGKTFQTFVMTRKQTGQCDTLESTGSYRRDSSTAVNNERYEAVSRQMLEIHKTVEGLGITASRLESQLNESAVNTQQNLHSVYESVSELHMDADSIRASVSDTQKMIDGVSGDLQETKNQMTSLKLESDVLSVEVSKIHDDGVKKVSNTTGIFNEDGLTIDSSNSPTKTQVTPDGMVVYKKSYGSDTAEVLSATSDGVDATNLHAKTYLIVGGRSRFENYGTDRTGCFWIGG